ncbi:MAG: hypothetical protein ACO21B_13330, partial [Gemmobacter sp.]
MAIARTSRSRARRYFLLRAPGRPIPASDAPGTRCIGATGERDANRLRSNDVSRIGLPDMALAALARSLGGRGSGG